MMVLSLWGFTPTPNMYCLVINKSRNFGLAMLCIAMQCDREVMKAAGLLFVTTLGFVWCYFDALCDCLRTKVSADKLGKNGASHGFYTAIALKLVEQSCSDLKLTFFLVLFGKKCIY